MNKSTNILIRVSEREKEEIKAAAKGMQMSMSEWIIYCCRKELAKNTQ